MRIGSKLILMLGIIVSTMTIVGMVKVQGAEEMTTYFDSQIPGIRIQVFATSQTQPTGNATVVLNLISETNVHVDHFNLQLFGFLNGTTKLSLRNVTDNDFTLNNASKQYALTVDIPSQVWGVLYGEAGLTYSTTLGGMDLTFRDIITGFTLTKIENTLLENLQTQLKTLNTSYNELTEMYTNLNGDFEQLNNTYWELQANYTSLTGNLGELDNTRRLSTILGVTTAFFVATTIYLVVRKPKEIW